MDGDVGSFDTLIRVLGFALVVAAVIGLAILTRPGSLAGRHRPPRGGDYPNGRPQHFGKIASVLGVVPREQPQSADGEQAVIETATQLSDHIYDYKVLLREMDESLNVEWALLATYLENYRHDKSQKNFNDVWFTVKSIQDRWSSERDVIHAKLRQIEQIIGAER